MSDGRAGQGRFEQDSAARIPVLRAVALAMIRRLRGEGSPVRSVAER
ncbi:MAG: hypothetical protein HYY39_06875 [Armatimonadetes bacterium]|nr:hypothetical protein [Armatimonadota bacterium]